MPTYEMQNAKVKTLQNISEASSTITEKCQQCIVAQEVEHFVGIWPRSRARWLTNDLSYPLSPCTYNILGQVSLEA